MAEQKTELRYLDLKNHICKQIYLGTYGDGDRIPSERQLAADYNVSRITVRKALELMEEEKLIRREVGNGTILQYRNRGNSTPLDMLSLVAPSKNPFFSKFIAYFQKIAWEQGALLLYVEVPENSTLEDCLFRLYQRDIRNAVIWPDDQTLQNEKLLRLRSIGMNLVFFDTDDGFPYGDCVHLDNREAISGLLHGAGDAYETCVYVGWDNLDIPNVRKREEAFRFMKPDGQVIHVPWRRDRKIMKTDLETVLAQLPEVEKTMLLCGTGEIGQQFAEFLWDQGAIPAKMMVVDAFEGSGKYPVAIYEQDLKEMARIVFEQLKKQVHAGSQWQAERIAVAGIYRQ